MKRWILGVLLLAMPLLACAAQSTDYTLDNQPGLQFRTELNSVLAAVQSQNSGATAPASPAPYMVWADTATGKLKMRNAANTDWIDLFALTGIPAASTSAAGIVELATQAEVDAGTDAVRAVTPATLAGRTTTGTAAGKIPLRDGSGKLPGDILGNADTVDGFHASQAPVANQIPVLKADGTMGLLPSFSHGSIGGATSVGLEVRSGGAAGDAAFMLFHRPGYLAWYLGMDTDGKLKYGGYSLGANAYQLRHDANTFHGRVASDGTAIRLPSGWTSSRPSPGQFTVTHNLGTVNYTVVPSVRWATGGVDLTCLVFNKTSAAFDVLVRDVAGTPAYSSQPVEFVLMED